MSEEMPPTSTHTPAASSMVTSPASASSKPPSVSSSSSAVAASSYSSASSANEPREYILPVSPRMRLGTNNTAGKKDKDDDDRQYYQVPIPGVLCQTGTLDASVWVYSCFVFHSTLSVVVIPPPSPPTLGRCHQCIYFIFHPTLNFFMYFFPFLYIHTTTTNLQVLDEVH